jgi:S1-C subfamily serine protease
MISVTPELARHSTAAKTIPADQTDGVFVVKVQPNTPASESGFQEGDVVVKIDKDVIHDSSDLFSKLKAGKQIDVEVRRGDKERKVLKVTPMPLSTRTERA